MRNPIRNSPRRGGGALVALVVLCLGALAWQGRAVQEAESVDAAQALRAERFAEFAASLSGVQLVGYFTDSNQPEDAPLSKDRYTISKVSHFKDDTWRFDCRIQYGSRDLTVPLLLEVQWAGDTPVITLTDMLVPGMGTFTARVLIYRGEYAGTWRGANHGGQMFGRVEKLADPEGGDGSGADKDGG